MMMMMMMMMNVDDDVVGMTSARSRDKCLSVSEYPPSVQTRSVLQAQFVHPTQRNARYATDVTYATQEQTYPCVAAVASDTSLAFVASLASKQYASVLRCGHCVRCVRTRLYSVYHNSRDASVIRCLPVSVSVDCARD